jgi:hypothetical protein
VSRGLSEPRLWAALEDDVGGGTDGNDDDGVTHVVLPLRVEGLKGAGEHVERGLDAAMETDYRYVPEVRLG